METIKQNRDFLFLYEAIQNNPNGDPDQENKPRMDYETNTNLVTDVRLKRFIRDWLKSQGYEIFVSLDDDAKVSPETKLDSYLNKIVSPGLADEIFSGKPELKEKFMEIVNKKKKDETLAKLLKEKSSLEVNKYLLSYLISRYFMDVRMFGSAFAIKGFTYAYTGAIQINWGYSLNKVYPMESNSIVTIMSDEASTFGKDYRIWYSLLAFYGTINEKAAKQTFLTEEDVVKFREAIWKGIHALPTRTKQNQYPLLYLEIKYKPDISNGMLADLRQYLHVKPKDNLTYKQVRKFDDLDVDFSKLYDVLANNDLVDKIYMRRSDKINLELPNVELI